MMTTGGQEGVFLAIQAVIDPGDEILVPDPRYTSYDDAIRRAGGKMVMVPTNRARRFQPGSGSGRSGNHAGEQSAFDRDTKQSDRRHCHRRSLAQAIADVAIRHNLIIIVDEIYGKIVYEPWRHFSIGSLPGMAERTITLDAFSKTYAMTGWRCGYVAAPARRH